MAILCFALILDVLAVCLFCRLHALKQQRKKERFKEQAESRLWYIRSLLEMVYTYQRKPEQLVAHLREEMCANKLLSYRVIEDRSDEVFDPVLKISKTDRLLYLLLEDGLTPREISIIFELNNLNSVYVKYHRVRKKLSDSGMATSEDILPETSYKQQAGPQKPKQTSRKSKKSDLAEIFEETEIPKNLELVEGS